MGNIKKFRLDDHQRFEGMWALSLEELFEKNGFTFSDEAKPGNLELSEGRISLDLNGSFNDLNSNLVDETYRIYGYLSSGLFVILEKCFITNISFSAPGYEVETYHASLAYVLAKNPTEKDFNAEESIVATKVYFGIDYLDEWYNIELPSYEDSNDEEGFLIRHKNTFFDENKFEVDGGNYILRLQRKLIANQVMNQGARAIYDPFISITTKDYTEKSIETLFEAASWVLRFTDFITQTFGKYNYFEFYLEDAINNDSVETLENGDCIFHDPLYKGRLIFPQTTKKARKLSRSTLKLRDIKSDFEKLISAWFEKKDELKYIIDLYYQNVISDIDIETVLVNQIKMMETYYDNFLQGKSENISDKEARVEEVKDQIKDWMVESGIEVPIKEEIIKKLDRASKPVINLREKLTALLEGLPTKLKCIFLEIDPEWENNKNFLKEYAERLRDTRNFYTHGANKNKNKKRLETTEDLVLASSILECVTYYYVLKSIYGDENDRLILQLPYLMNKIR